MKRDPKDVFLPYVITIVFLWAALSWFIEYNGSLKYKREYERLKLEQGQEIKLLEEKYLAMEQRYYKSVSRQNEIERKFNEIVLVVGELEM